MYAELHALSAFSFQRGASLPQELVERAADLGYAALALTDECSMAGAVRAWQAGQARGLPVIVGSEFTVSDGPKFIALAQSQRGYAGLCQTITRGCRAAIKGQYQLQRADLETPLPEACVLWLPRGPGDAEELAWLRERYDRQLWIATELHRDGDDAAKLERLTALSRRFGVPMVASGDVHMHRRSRRALQDVLTALKHHLPVQHCGQRLFANGERHLRSIAELQALYPPTLLQESLAIAERCAFRLGELHYDYPREIVPTGHTLQSWLRALVKQHIPERWPEGCPPEVRAVIEKELQLIAQKRYEAFFLTVYDIVRYARSQNILCQGRGSAANSVVCYTLGITAVSPGFTELLFERFVSNERDEPPDIDVDFEHERREEVIQYIYRKYGRERAALAATVIHYRPRSALRDVGRALDIGAEVIDRVAQSLAWWDDPDGLPERLRQLGLDPDAQAIRLWLQLSRTLLEFPRHLSQHVGGFVISDAPLSALVPVENAAMPERTIIQWDKDDLEALGLLKVDVLALGMLSALRRSFELLRAFDGTELSLQRIPKEDRDTYAMISRGETLGVFQIESRAQMSMLPRLQPQNLYDLTVQIAIVRPGPIEGGMVHPYLQNRARKTSIRYPSEGVRKTLERTHGVPIFQEQVMRLVVIAAGFTPGEADQVRRSMAAWKRSGGLEKFHEKLIRGMLANGYDIEFAERIYKQILGFGSYGFPESHAASFALLAYASAWLKCHHPAAFLAALINSQPMGFYPVSMLVAEARRRGTEVLPVDVTASSWDCTLVPDDQGQPAMRLGLRLVAGFNCAAAIRLCDARQQRAFDNVGDLAQRARLNRRELEALASADALSHLAGHRFQARWQTRGHARLDGLLRETTVPDDAVTLQAPAEGEDILADYRSTGLSLRRHPTALLRPRLERQHIVPNAGLQQIAHDRPVRVAGIVMFRQRPGTAKGTMFMTLEDDTGIVNLIIWPKLIERQRDIIVGARFVLVRGRLQRQQGVTHVLAEAFADRSHWLAGLPHLSRDFR